MLPTPNDAPTLLVEHPELHAIDSLAEDRAFTGLHSSETRGAKPICAASLSQYGQPLLADFDQSETLAEESTGLPDAVQNCANASGTYDHGWR